MQGHLKLLDPAAGEGAYTEHLPDGMRVPALELVHRGWHAALMEPLPPTFSWLQKNFRTYAPPEVQMIMYGLHDCPAVSQTSNGHPTDCSTPRKPLQRPMWALASSIPELTSTVPGGLPPVARQRLQFFSAFDIGTPNRMKDEYACPPALSMPFPRCKVSLSTNACVQNLQPVADESPCWSAYYRRASCCWV